MHLLRSTKQSFSYFGGAVVISLPFEWDDVSIFVKLEKIKYWAGIKYLFLKGNTLTQIKYELDSMYEDSAP